jgi:hypothetical protein
MYVLHGTCLLCLGLDLAVGKTAHNRHMNPISRQAHASMIAHISLTELKGESRQFWRHDVFI